MSNPILEVLKYSEETSDFKEGLLDFIIDFDATFEEKVEAINEIILNLQAFFIENSHLLVRK